MTQSLKLVFQLLSCMFFSPEKARQIVELYQKENPGFKSEEVHNKKHEPPGGLITNVISPHTWCITSHHARPGKCFKIEHESCKNRYNGLPGILHNKPQFINYRKQNQNEHIKNKTFPQNLSDTDNLFYVILSFFLGTTTNRC